MKLWYTLFIVTFVTLYGTLSLALLGSWAYERVRSLRNAHRVLIATKKKTGHSRRGRTWERR